MFCTQCGTNLDAEARFCTACGKPVAHPPVSEAPFGTAPPGAPPPPFNEAPPGGSAPPYADAPSSAAGNGYESAQPRRRLRRILSNKKIAGVCSGFAEYFDMDVTLMRLIWVGLLLIPPHIGAIAYVIAWAVLPKS